MVDCTENVEIPIVVEGKLFLLDTTKFDARLVALRQKLDETLTTEEP